MAVMESNEYRIRKIKAPDGKVYLFPLTDNQVMGLKVIDAFIDAMVQVSQKLNPPQPPTSSDYCQQQNQQ